MLKTLLAAEASVKGMPRCMQQLGLTVLPSFCSEKEESSLVAEIQARLAQQRSYQEAHWDGVITQSYKETEILNWESETNAAVFQRMTDAVQDAPHDQVWRPAHVLELPEGSDLGPHVDSEKICGEYVVGLSLLSDSVMRLVKEDDADDAYRVLLQRRSLYVLSAASRHEFTHAIEEKHQEFNGHRVHKGRRISVMARDW